MDLVMNSYLGPLPGTTRPSNRTLPAARPPGAVQRRSRPAWAILEGPWALQHGASTIELCRDRGVSFLVDTQPWRYHDHRTFLVEKFTTTPYAPDGPLTASDRSALNRFVKANLETQATLGASAYLLPGVIPEAQPRETAPRLAAEGHRRVDAHATCHQARVQRDRRTARRAGTPAPSRRHRRSRRRDRRG